MPIKGWKEFVFGLPVKLKLQTVKNRFIHDQFIQEIDQER